MPLPPDLLESIRQRPGLHFGDSPPLTSLCYFIQGYEWATTDRSTLPSDFSGWIAYRTGASRVHHWLGMLLSVSEDETVAFRRFFELLDEHKTRAERVIAKVTGHGWKRTILTAINFDCPEAALPGEKLTFGEEALPDPILILTYTDDPGFLTRTDDGYGFGTWGYWKSWDEMAEREGFLEEHVEILDAAEFERIRHAGREKAGPA